MEAQTLVRRYWLPTLLFGAFTAAVSWSINVLTPDWHQPVWWAVLVGGLIGAAAATVWAFRIQQDVGSRSNSATTHQTAYVGGNTYLSADRGGIAAVNIEGGVRTSVLPPEPEDQHQR